MLAFIQSHSAVLAGFIVAVIDLIIAVVPSLSANGILHAIVVFCQGKSQFAAAPTTPASGS